MSKNKKLEILSPEQEALIPIVRDEWLNRFFKPARPDLAQIKEGVAWLYKLAELPEPLTVVVDSPYAAQLVASWLPAFNDNEVEKAIRAFGNQSVKGRQDMLCHIYQEGVVIASESSKFALLTELPGFQIAWNVVQQAIDQKIENLYKVGIGTPLDATKFTFDPRAMCIPPILTASARLIFDAAVKVVCSHQLKYTDFAYHFNCMDYHWVAFYDYFTRIGIINHAPFNEYLRYLQAGVYESIQLRGLCVVSTMPQTVKRNDQNRLDSVNGEPAIKFHDKAQYKLYYINGVYFQPKLYKRLTSGDMTAQEILKLDNAEQKGIALKLFGYEKLVKEIGGKVVDQHLVDIHGKEAIYELIETDLKDHPLPARFVKVVCWSTGKETMLRVPYDHPQCQTALGAIAWTADMTKEEYVLDLET